MNVLGLDLSLNGPGFCYAPDRVASMRMTAKEGDRRLVRIRDAVQYYVTSEISRYPRARTTGGYSLAVIESVPGGPGGGAQGALDRVHAVAREVLARYGVPFVYVNGSTLKVYATGSGDASKQDMIDALPEPVRSMVANDDEADAWWLADMGRAAGGDMELWTTLPAHQINALSKVPWPIEYAGFGVATTRSKAETKQCGHGYYCLVNAGRLLHPMLLDVCDKPAKAKRRVKS